VTPLAVTSPGAASFPVPHARRNDQPSAITLEQRMPPVLESLLDLDAIGLPAGSARDIPLPISHLPPV
jgi:hypothetical protein